jgi:Sulfotransferase domain
MPDFMGIGGQRCGTTWLFAHLLRHPEVAFPAGKEIHYWDNRAHEGAKPWLEMFPPAPAGVKRGEVTPAYAILPESVVAQIALAVPDLRLVLSIRNPIARSWSAALWCVQRCQMDPDEPSDAWFLDVVTSWRCRAKSTFSSTIDLWRAAFSDEQLLLVVYDDISVEPSALLRRVAVHLGIDPGFYDSDAPTRATRGIATSARRTPSETVLNVLRDLHQDEVRRLEILLDRDLAHWLTWNGT